MQGLLGAAHWGFGNGGGNILGGFIYDRWGPVILFRFAALSVSTGLILLALTRFIRLIACRSGGGRSRNNSGNEALLDINASSSSISRTTSSAYNPPASINTLN
jgi:MFS family permease